jgi:2-hydroxy-3-keto-5-methylthiopentenyl-1-phosphate phosphatase
MTTSEKLKRLGMEYGSTHHDDILQFLWDKYGIVINTYVPGERNGMLLCVAFGKNGQISNFWGDNVIAETPQFNRRVDAIKDCIDKVLDHLNATQKQKTAMMQLFEWVKKNDIAISTGIRSKINELLEVEKQQIIEAREAEFDPNGEEYYEQTYGA